MKNCIYFSLDATWYCCIVYIFIPDKAQVLCLIEQICNFNKQLYFLATRSWFIHLRRDHGQPMKLLPFLCRRGEKTCDFFEKATVSNAGKMRKCCQSWTLNPNSSNALASYISYQSYYLALVHEHEERVFASQQYRLSLAHEGTKFDDVFSW